MGCALRLRVRVHVIDDISLIQRRATIFSRGYITSTFTMSCRVMLASLRLFSIMENSFRGVEFLGLGRLPPDLDDVR